MTRRVRNLRQGRLRSIRGYPGAADTVRGSPTVLAGASYINLPKSNHHAGPDEKFNDIDDNPGDVKTLWEVLWWRGLQSHYKEGGTE